MAARGLIDADVSLEIKPMGGKISVFLWDYIWAQDKKKGQEYYLSTI